MTSIPLLQKNTVLLTLFIISITACKKDDKSTPGPTPDTSAPVITVYSPNDGDTLSISTGVALSYRITDNVSVRIVEFLTTIPGTGDTINYSVEQHNAVFLNQSTTLSLSGVSISTPVQLSIKASDEAGNTANKQITFQVIP
jgi:hypothetical protein